MPSEVCCLLLHVPIQDARFGSFSIGEGDAHFPLGQSRGQQIEEFGGLVTRIPQSACKQKGDWGMEI